MKSYSYNNLPSRATTSRYWHIQFPAPINYYYYCTYYYTTARTTTARTTILLPVLLLVLLLLVLYSYFSYYYCRTTILLLVLLLPVLLPVLLLLVLYYHFSYYYCSYYTTTSRTTTAVLPTNESENSKRKINVSNSQRAKLSILHHGERVILQSFQSTYS